MKALYDIYSDCRERYKLHLTAGRAGLSRNVSWVYASEDIDNIGFIDEGELIITTGLTYDGTERWLTGLADSLLEVGASGLIINIGPYISAEDITPGVRSHFDRIGLPLILMAWDVHRSALIHEITELIVREDIGREVISSLFAELLLEQTEKPDVALKLQRFGFINSMRYNAVVISGIASDAFVRDVLDARGITYHILSTRDAFAVILQADDDELTAAVIDEIFRRYGVSRGDRIADHCPVIGMGEAETELSKIKYSYLNAVNALRIARQRDINYFRFRDLGIYQILLSIDDTDMLVRIMNEHLGPLEAYDAAYGTNLLDTLDAYLRCNGSVNEVASELFTHRNTINYRMKKIRELLPFDMNDTDNLFVLKMSFYIRNNLIDR